jgi:hypothetical protein
MKDSRENAMEQECYDWMLAQRILFTVGALDERTVTKLRSLPGMPHRKIVTSGELSHALFVDHEELNSAFETWWNLCGKSADPLTFAEIRVKAAIEM